MNDYACIIVNYNDSKTTIRLLERIKEFSVFSLILVVDNCSSDNSFSELKEWTNNKIKVIKSERNGGYGYGNNWGMEYCHSLGYKYVVITNPDVVFDEQLILDLMNNLTEDTAMVTAKQLDWQQREIKMISWKIPSIIQACVYPFKPDAILYTKEFLTSKDCIEVECIPGAFFVASVEKMISIGGYDESIFMYCEESLIGIKLKKAGYKVKLLTDKTYLHEHPHNREKEIKSEIKMHRIWKNNRLYIIKNYLNAPVLMYILACTIYNINLMFVSIKNMGKRFLFNIGLIR